MLRAILAVIAGYAAMFIVVALGLTLAYLALGPDWAYQAGTYDITPRWGILMLAVGLLAAILGGVACALIAKRSRNPVFALIAAIVVLSALSAAYQLSQPAPEDTTRAENDSVTDAANKARQPLWTLIANPIIGAVGVFLGAALVGTPLRSADTDQ
jgi:uncharacterized membrane protein YfcA